MDTWHFTHSKVIRVKKYLCSFLHVRSTLTLFILYISFHIIPTFSFKIGMYTKKRKTMVRVLHISLVIYVNLLYRDRVYLYM